MYYFALVLKDYGGQKSKTGRIPNLEIKGSFEGNSCYAKINTENASNFIKYKIAISFIFAIQIHIEKLNALDRDRSFGTVHRYCS